MTRNNYGPDNDFAIRFQKMEAAVAALSTRNTLQNASVGAGGILITGGGSIDIEGGGTLILNGVNLAGLIGAATLPQVFNVTDGIIGVGTAYNQVVGGDFGVPNGYTRALILAIGTCNMGSVSASGSDEAWARVVIAGHIGPEAQINFSTSNNTTLAPSNAVTLTGLTAGSLLHVEVDAKFLVGTSGSAQGAISAMCLFLP